MISESHQLEMVMRVGVKQDNQHIATTKFHASCHGLTAACTPHKEVPTVRLLDTTATSTRGTRDRMFSREKEMAGEVFL